MGTSILPDPSTNPDYRKINKVDLDGDGNIVIQDAGGATITLNYTNTVEIKRLLTQAGETVLSEIRDLLAAKNFTGNRDFEDTLKKYLGLSPEIRQMKDQISRKIDDLKLQLNEFKKDDLDEDTVPTGENDFEDLNFDELIESIENGTCVLFLGPEISVDPDGKSIHEKYYRSFSDDNLYYDAKEGLFQPGDIYKLLNNSPKFYDTQFHELNKKGNAILQKLARIPFSIIVSYCPDDTICRVLSKYNVPRQFLVYDGTELSTSEIDWNKLVIYNALGCLAHKKGKYIFTYQQVNSYIETAQKIKIPYSLENKILQDCTHFIFIGFDFDKWYYRLLLFLFKFKDYSKRIAFEEGNKIEIKNRNFVFKQFGIHFENSQYDDFATILLKKVREAGLSRSLDSELINSISEELHTIRIRNFDSNKLEQLDELSKMCDNLEIKIKAGKE